MKKDRIPDWGAESNGYQKEGGQDSRRRETKNRRQQGQPETVR